MNIRLILSGLVACAALALAATAGAQIFVTNASTGTIGEYNATTGAPVNPR
jgi:hypothetical protein